MAFKVLGPAEIYDDSELLARDLQKGELYVSVHQTEAVVVLETQSFSAKTFGGYETYCRIWFLIDGQIVKSTMHKGDPVSWVRIDPWLCRNPK